MKREIVIIPEDEMHDFTNQNYDFTSQNFVWAIKGENYKYIDRYISSTDKGNWYKVIVQRQSDQKYFQFTWADNIRRSCFEYFPEWEQVEPKTVTETKIITTTIWGWDKDE